MIWNEIICLGDSWTYGARDSYGRSYPAELGRVLSEETGEFYICHNYGVNGDTSSDLLRRTWRHLKSDPDARIVLILIGTNDTKTPIPIDIYEDNIRQIVSSVKANRRTPILGLLPPLVFNPNYMFNREYIDIYNKSTKDLSGKLGYMTSSMEDLGDDLIDGVHLTHNGYKEMAKKWCQTILSLR